VTPGDLLGLLQEFHRETAELVQARQVAARSVTDYNINNAYQQVLERQDVHLRWLADAIEALGGDPVSQIELASGDPTEPRRNLNALLEADQKAQRSLLDRWRPRVDVVTNARHRKMLELVLGEMAEHLRVFDHALDGRDDLLGRHADGKVARGEVMAARPRN
jgi:hypothetical protein